MSKETMRPFSRRLALSALLFYLSTVSLLLAKPELGTATISASHMIDNRAKNITLFRGDFNYQNDTLKLTADEAQAQQKGKQLERLQLEGSARFEHRTPQGEQVNATADKIDYLIAQQQIIMSGNVIIDQANRQIKGETITYDIEQGLVSSNTHSTQSSSRVKLTLSPTIPTIQH